MSKRIFTKVFEGVLQAGATPVHDNARDTWLVQENIEVIGASISVGNTAPSENDGFASVIVELSQVGLREQDGAILSAKAFEGWNTTPAGVDVALGHIAIAFPQGYAVPVKEEGYLYVNAYTQGKSAGVSGFDYVVIVYYTKGSSGRR
ncbi:hypothetical protein ES703_121213 [subsurface metagenome]